MGRRNLLLAVDNWCQCSLKAQGQGPWQEASTNYPPHVVHRAVDTFGESEYTDQTNPKLFLLDFLSLPLVQDTGRRV